MSWGYYKIFGFPPFRYLIFRHKTFWHGRFITGTFWHMHISALWTKVFWKFVCFNLLFLVFSFVFREVENDWSWPDCYFYDVCFDNLKSFGHQGSLSPEYITLNLFFSIKEISLTRSIPIINQNIWDFFCNNYHFEIFTSEYVWCYKSILALKCGWLSWVVELSREISFYVCLYWISVHINLVFCSQFN